MNYVDSGIKIFEECNFDLKQSICVTSLQKMMVMNSINID